MFENKLYIKEELTLWHGMMRLYFITFIPLGSQGRQRPIIMGAGTPAEHIAAVDWTYQGDRV